jgi:hypothetical protein
MIKSMLISNIPNNLYVVCKDHRYIWVKICRCSHSHPNDGKFNINDCRDWHDDFGISHTIYHRCVCAYRINYEEQHDFTSNLDSFDGPNVADIHQRIDL